MKRFRIRLWPAALAVLAVIATGCGGFSGSRSVSPATFFLPGLMQNDVHQPVPGEPTAPTPAAAESESRSS